MVSEVNEVNLSEKATMPSPNTTITNSTPNTEPAELQDPRIKNYLSFWAEHNAEIRAKEEAKYLEFWEEIEANYEFNDTAKVTIR